MFFVAMPYALVILFSLDMSNGAMETKRCKKVFFMDFFPVSAPGTLVFLKFLMLIIIADPDQAFGF